MWGIILKVWGNGEKKHKVNAEFTHVGQLNRGPRFNIAAHGIRKGSNSLVGWLKHGPKDGK